MFNANDKGWKEKSTFVMNCVSMTTHGMHFMMSMPFLSYVFKLIWMKIYHIYIKGSFVWSYKMHKYIAFQEMPIKYYYMYIDNLNRSFKLKS